MSELLSSAIVALSPHADDAVLSCGGLLLQHPDAMVVTMCTADSPGPRPSALSGLASPAVRREEDRAAMARLGCGHRELGFADAIDRQDETGRRLYRSWPALFGPVSPEDAGTCAEILARVEPLLNQRILLCPLAVGAHVDHQLCAHVGRRLVQAGRTVWFYQDAPYVFPDPGPACTGDTALKAARRMRAQIRAHEDVPLEVVAKSRLLACYSTQIASLFGDLPTYEALASAHYQSLGGEVERFHKLAWAARPSGLV